MRHISMIEIESIKKQIELAAMLKFKAKEYILDHQYEQAIQVHLQMKMNSRVYFNIGSLYKKMGDLEISKLYFKKAVSLDEWLSIAYYMLAVIHQQLMEYGDATFYYQKALKSMRQHSVIEYEQIALYASLYKKDVLLNMSICQYKLENYGNACDLLKEAKQLDPNLPKDFKSIMLIKPVYFNELLLFQGKRSKPYHTHMYMGHFGSKIIAKNKSTHFHKLFNVKQKDAYAQ
eukprot:NODE_224_length_12322_cov_0.795549.p5 type:complete len:232 gc:universal NODE_224_length_12322_cov_0.795549:9027-8332(-)